MWPQWPENHTLNRHIVAQPIEKIAELAGIDINADTAVPLCGGKRRYRPRSAVPGRKAVKSDNSCKTENFEDAMDKMEAVMNYMGNGHGCGHPYKR